MSRAEMQALGWKELDVLLVNGDAYVDHPAFGPVLLGRWLVAHGFRVGIVAQPRWQSPDDLLVMGRPRLFVGVSAGALDSMLAHYTAFRKKRHDDAYTPGGKAGARPNRACLVYANLARQAFPGLPVILGGIEASLRRTTHYDFWTDSLRRSILLDAKADLLIYGMGELAMLECARRLAEGKSLHGIDGTAWLAKVDENNVPVDLPEEWLDLPRMQLPSHEAVQAEATELLRLTQMLEQQVHRQNAWAQQMVGDRALVLAPPARPLTTEEMDKIYALPYARAAHPRYREPIPADGMLRTSITSHRGCGGGCSFCSLALHQGRRISSRSQESILAEARKLVAQSRRGQVAISDVGGPTANMWQAHCALDDATSAKAEPGARPSSRCRRSSCCYPMVCKSFITPQMQHVGLLREVAALPGVRQVRVASGVRADLALNDPEALAAYTGEFTGGQLKVAPEHCAARVLDLMRKPGMEVFEAFLQSFVEQSRLAGREQYVVPYMMSAFPGCTDEDMHELARWLQERHWSPQQTQCFIPTPGSIATAMYYCGRNEDGEEIYVARSDADRLRQHRILMPDFGRMPERGGHADAEDAGEGHHREPRRENTTERWRDERRSADGLAPRHEGRRDFREDRKPPFPRFDDEREGAPRRDFRHPDRDGFRKPGFRQDVDKPFRPRPFPDAARDGDEAPQARPSFRRDGQDERPFRPRGDRFVDREGEEARRPFRPRRDDDDGRPFRKDGFRPRRFNDRDGNEGQDAWKRPRPFARFDDEQDEAPRRDFRHPDRDGFRKPGFRQDADKPFRPRPFPDAARDGDEAPQARPSFRRDGQDERPFRPRGDRFVDRDGEEARRPFRPRRDDDGQPFRKDGFRPRRFNDRDGNEGQDGQKRRAPFPRFDDEREGAPRRDFRRPDRDGFRKPGFRQDADKPFRPRPFPDAARDGDEAPQARPSFRRDGQDERPFRPRGDRFVNRDGEEARRPFRPRRDDEGRPFRKDGFRPRRFNDSDGDEGQDGQKRRAPFPRFDDEREGAPRRDFRRPDRDGFRKPGFRQDADKPFRKNSFRRDGKPAFGSRRRDRNFDGPALNDDEE
ncbi:YgiQ family radical SAM protein [Desulfovibrio piger]|uniref:YgiQ family radical SAM protein n=1 Tax=Desulfovibrio piger TaxID=901 RepID=A0A848C4N0_9BACT|nr:YgiQ family radical SAM protein [Desulfovibrio piger]